MSGFRVLSIRAERSNEEKPSKKVLKGKGIVVQRVVLSGTSLQLSKVHNEAARRVVGKPKDLVAHFFNFRRIGRGNIRDEIS